MGDQKWTPGPWKVVERGNVDIFSADDAVDGKFIAGMSPFRMPDETAANACLIAAAPETIAALSTAHAWLTRWAVHVGNCAGGVRCTCGLTAITVEAEIALIKAQPVALSASATSDTPSPSRGDSE